MSGRATVVTVSPETEKRELENWVFRGHDYLLKDLNEMVLSKRVGSTIMYSIFLFLAMLAVFDTQVLSIFRRKREIGTLVALGMTRKEVVGLFTLEGSVNGVLAALAGAVYGTPLLMLFARTGLSMPEEAMDDFGYALSEELSGE